MDVVPKLTFGFGGPSDEGLTCKVVSDDYLELTVVDGHNWAKLGGPLMLTKAVFGEHEVVIFLIFTFLNLCPKVLTLSRLVWTFFA